MGWSDIGGIMNMLINLKPKFGIYAFVWMYVEVDLEKGLPKAIDLQPRKWISIQKMDNVACSCATMNMAKV